MRPSKDHDILLVDPSLRSADGHHLGVLERFRDEFALHGISCASLVSRYASPSFCAGHRLQAAFEKSIYSRNSWTRAEHEECARTFERDLRAGIDRLGIRAGIFILPAADQSLVLALARYLEEYRLFDPPRILLSLMFAPNFRESIACSSAHALFAEYREAFELLRKVVANPARLRIFCETDAMARAYEGHVGHPVETLIVHKKIERPRQRARRPAGAPIAIVCAGNANSAKGYGLLPEVIERVNAHRQDISFLIHGTIEQTDNARGREWASRLEKLGPNVTVRTGIFSTAEYLDWLRQADLVLQPYDPSAYSTRGSGVFAEAVRLGIPAVATSGCAFAAEAIAERRAVAIERYDAPAIAEAIDRAADMLDEITDNALTYAERHADDSTFQTVIAETAASGRADKRRLSLGRGFSRIAFAARTPFRHRR